MAMYVLEYPDCPNSPIFDMEAIFWILVYIPLHRKKVLGDRAVPRCVNGLRVISRNAIGALRATGPVITGSP
jgi:hypothetical protein